METQKENVNFGRLFIPGNYKHWLLYSGLDQEKAGHGGEEKDSGASLPALKSSSTPFLCSLKHMALSLSEPQFLHLKNGAMVSSHNVAMRIK